MGPLFRYTSVYSLRGLSLQPVGAHGAPNLSLHYFLVEEKKGEYFQLLQVRLLHILEFLNLRLQILLVYLL